MFPQLQETDVRIIPALIVLASTASPVLAQQASGSMPDSYRQVQLNMLELQRSMLTAMVDSMPETLYRDAVTPIQRDFAEQITHAAGAVVMVGTRYMNGTAPTLPDTAAALNTRAGLRAFVNGVYDWASALLKSQSAESRAEVVNFFGMSQIPRWEVWDEIHQHTIWTAGQVVANFRKHNMAPPGFGFF